jgi:hypothetical protein
MCQLTLHPLVQASHFNKNIDEHDKISRVKRAPYTVLVPRLTAAQVKGDLDEVKSVMVQNIEKVCDLAGSGGDISGGGGHSKSRGQTSVYCAVTSFVFRCWSAARKSTGWS